MKESNKKGPPMPLSSAEEEWQRLPGPGSHADTSPLEDSVRKPQLAQTPIPCQEHQNFGSPQQLGLHPSRSKAHNTGMQKDPCDVRISKESSLPPKFPD